MLVVYCLKGVSLTQKHFGIPELVSCLVVVGLHLWRENTLLSIGAGTLFMALLRSVGIPCRVHGFTIDKILQKGAMTGFVYRNANNTYIQSEGINQDFGIYACPDDLLKEHHQELSFFKEFLYRHLGRHLMNHNVSKIRKKGAEKTPKEDRFGR